MFLRFIVSTYRLSIFVYSLLYILVVPTLYGLKTKDPLQYTGNTRGTTNGSHRNNKHNQQQLSQKVVAEVWGHSKLSEFVDDKFGMGICEFDVFVCCKIVNTPQLNRRRLIGLFILEL